jgi:hypothetical protein
VFESNKLYSTGSFSAILDPDEEENTQAQEKGFIIFEYSKNQTAINEDNKKDIVDCWSNEIVVAMNPYSELIENSKCETVKNSEFSTKLVKIDNQLFDVYEFSLNESISLDERIILEKQKLKIKFNHDTVSYDNNKYGSLMIIAHYDFPFLSMKSKLSRATGSRQKFIKYGEANVYEEELGTETSLTQMSNTITYTIPNTLYSSSGSILEAEFSLTDKFLSLFDEGAAGTDICFPLNLMIEYVPPNTGANADEEDDGELTSNIRMVAPAMLSEIPITKFHNITLQVFLDKSITEAYPDIDLTSSLSGTLISQMCALEHSEGTEFDIELMGVDNLFTKTSSIFPVEYSVSEDYKTIYLQFPVTQAFQGSCYKLVCRKDPTIVRGKYYDLKEISNLQTSF